MRRVLFVDDELNVLQGLRRILYKMRYEWEMKFAEGGEDALEILNRSFFDVIVTDLLMPGMNGVQLLKIVKERYPHMIRIILSGQAEEDLLIETVGITHQYQSKPCDANLLKTTIDRAFSLRDALLDDRLKNLVSKIERLPTLPLIYLEVLEEIQSDNASIKKVGKIISQDVGLSAGILKLINSAYFGIRRRVKSIEEAVIFVGLNIIQSLVLSSKVFSQFDTAKLKPLSMEVLYEHSIIAGTLAKFIAEMETNNAMMISDSLTAGILHDTGKLIIADNLPSQYRNVLVLVNEKGITEWQAEMEVLGATQSEIGAHLLKLWGLPDSIVEALVFHYWPSKCIHQQFSPLTAVHVANVFAQKLTGNGNGNRRKTVTEDIDYNYMNNIGLNDKLLSWENSCEKILQEGKA